MQFIKLPKRFGIATMLLCIVLASLSVSNATAGTNYACLYLCDLKFEASLTKCAAERAVCDTSAKVLFASQYLACQYIRARTARVACETAAEALFDETSESCRVNEGRCAKNAGRDYENCKALCSFVGGEPH